jgi:hypothetical protein
MDDYRPMETRLRSVMQFAFAKLCAYFAIFAVMPFVYRRDRKETAKARKELRSN